MSATSRDERRTAAVVVLLAMALVLTAVLTWQAADAARSHRRTAQRAVSDLAAIAADELIRRSSAEIEAYGFVPVRQAIYYALTRNEPMPDIAKLNAIADDRLRRALPLVGPLFSVDLENRRVVPPNDPALDAWLVSNLWSIVEKRRQAGETQVVRHDGKLIAYFVGQAEQRILVGFVVNEPALTSFVERSFERRSIFPPSAGGGKLTNDDIFVGVTRGGRDLFRSKGTFNPEFGVTKTLSGEYGEIFVGASVQSSVRSQAAPMIVSGGVPQSRMPLLVVVLLTTAGVVIAAVFLLRRERALARLRSDFVSGVSHELRTPLTQIRMFAETLLLERVRSDDERQRSLEIIDQEARRLSHLVDNVLLFSRGERGTLQLEVEEHDASEIIRATVETFMPLASSRNVAFDTHVPRGLRVRLDADAWRQVVLNLLENAVKYGPAGQTVRVAAIADNGVFRMEIEDQGPGVPPSRREEIWQKFVRLERDRGTHKAGTGIGLAVVREIVQQHGGKCWVEDAPRTGARFVVEVPR